MNELLPYEDELKSKLANAPLPEESRGWEAMRRMLEDDDDEDVIVPPANKGCRNGALALLLLIVVAGIGIIMYKTTGRHDTSSSTTVPSLKDSGAIATASSSTGKNAKVTHNDPVVAQTKLATDSIKAVTDIIKRAPVVSMQKSIVKKIAGQKVKKATNTGSKTYSHSTPLSNKNNPVSEKAPQGNPLSTAIPQQTNTGKDAQSSPVANDLPSRPAVKQDSVKPSIHTGIIPNNPVVENKVPAIKADSATQKATKKDDDDGGKDKIWFGAGLALQQLIPVDGQKAVPYNAEGRKGSIGDYIPSVYFRAYQGKKMLQVEFKYGAPQYTKDITFEKKVISFDSTTHVSTSNVNHLKKTYYHQLPVSFHYNLLPNVYVGVGFVWNKFQSAVIEQTVQHAIGSVITDTTVTPGKIVNVKSDSSFAKSYFQFMAEAQYTWKRFSFGARYAWGLQPYITFTSPVTGQQQKERNASLNLFIRYQLWQSKKK